MALVGIVVLVSALQGVQVQCPVDKSSAYFTGNTKVDVSGKLLKEYKCNTFGHVFWVADSPSGRKPPPSAVQGVRCPVHGSSAYFTGKTKVDVSGKLLKEYKCNAFGDTFWVAN